MQTNNLGGELVVVYTTLGAMRAEIIRGKLESAGIPAMVKAEAQNVIPFTVNGLGRAQVLVPKAREQEARAVLETQA